MGHRFLYLLVSLFFLTACGSGFDAKQMAMDGWGELSSTWSLSAGENYLPGQVIVDPDHPQWFKKHGGSPYFICGPGDPEDFLYRGTRNSDGTRNGDQQQIVNRLIGTGANSIYMQAVRSHGGDGDSTHNPYIGSNPANGISTAVLDQWEQWFTLMDNNDILIYFFFYDDSARIWNTGDAVGNEERIFLETLVNRFEHHKNLIWIIAEEYTERYTRQRSLNMANVIRAADDHDHIIGNHQLQGYSFSHANDPIMDQFAIQTLVADDTPDELHSAMVTAWNNAAGRYNINMSENRDHNLGNVRQKNWAIAMGGAYTMVLRWFKGVDPSDNQLMDCGRLRNFFETTNFNEMAPHDELKFGATDYVLAQPGTSYIAYSSSASSLGIRNLTAGQYDLRWYDPIDGSEVSQTMSVSAGDQSFSKPAGIGSEVALHLRRSLDPGANTAPTANNQSVSVVHNTSTNITLTYSDPDGPGPYAFNIVTQPMHGTISGSGANRVYTPNSSYSGLDSFTFLVNDGLDDSSPVGQVTLNVLADGNQAPQAMDQSASSNKDSSVFIPLSYSDPDGPGPYDLVIVSQPSNGTLSGSGNDRTYTPNPGYVGSDSFTWQVNDGDLDSRVASVSLSVVEAGVAQITNVTAASGKIYEVGSGGLNIRRTVYIDRTYSYTYISVDLVGLSYLMTANNDKASTGNNFLTFNMDQDSTVYVAHDDRIINKPAWLGQFSDTGMSAIIAGNQHSVYAKDFAAGLVTLGGNVVTAQSTSSMYTVVVRGLGGGGTGTGTTDPPEDPVDLEVSDLAVSSGKNYMLRDAAFDNGENIFIDRSYAFENVDPSLIGSTYIETANGDKTSKGSNFLSFEVNQEVTIYVAHDDRISNKPTWLSAFSDSGMDVTVSGRSHSLYEMNFAAGTVNLGGNVVTNQSSSSMYSVIIRGLGGGGGTEPPADTTSPTVNISNPMNNAQVSGSVQITATASDDDQVARVDFYLGSDLLGSDSSAPFGQTLDTTTLSNSSYQVFAKAYDPANNMGTDSIGISVNNQMDPPGSTDGAITPVRIASGAGEFPDLAKGPDGNLHIVYARGSKIYYRKYTMATGAVSSEEATNANYIDAYKARPNIVVDSTGVIHVCGSTYVYKENGIWKSMNANLQRDVSMVKDSRDNIYITTRGSNSTENAGPGYIQIVKRVKGASSFSSPTNVDHVQPGRNNHIYGDLAISPVDDVLHAVYRHGNPTHHAYRQSTGSRLSDGSMNINNTWTISEGISGDDSEGPAVVVDNSNRVYSVSGTGTVYLRGINGGWSGEGKRLTGGVRTNVQLESDLQNNIYATGYPGQFAIRESGSWRFSGSVPSVTGKNRGHVNSAPGDGRTYLVWEETSSPSGRYGGGSADIVIGTLNSLGVFGQ